MKRIQVLAGHFAGKHALSVTICTVGSQIPAHAGSGIKSSMPEHLPLLQMLLSSMASPQS